MFRVPCDPNQPTFDQTFKVGFWRWLTSSATDRKEWARRRNAAARLAADNQVQRAHDALDRAREQTPRPTMPGAPRQTTPGLTTFGAFILGEDFIQYGTFRRRPLDGVTATVGELQRSGARKTTTAVRIATGSISAAADALGRAMGAQELTVAGPGFTWRDEVPAHKVDRAHQFAAAVNAAARGTG